MSETITPETVKEPKTRVRVPKQLGGQVPGSEKSLCDVPAIHRKTLEDLFHESHAVDINRIMAHQPFAVPGAGMEGSINCARAGMKNMKLRYHPGYGLIGFNGGEYFLTPSANVIVAYEKGRQA